MRRDIGTRGRHPVSEGARGIITVILWMLGACLLHAQTPISEWAFGGADHRLHYRYDARGNIVMNFSPAGYRAGGVKLPSAVLAERRTSVAGDHTTGIPAALGEANSTVV